MPELTLPVILINQLSTTMSFQQSQKLIASEQQVSCSRNTSSCLVIQRSSCLQGKLHTYLFPCACFPCSQLNIARNQLISAWNREIMQIQVQKAMTPGKRCTMELSTYSDQQWDDTVTLFSVLEKCLLVHTAEVWVSGAELWASNSISQLASV